MCSKCSRELQSSQAEAVKAIAATAPPPPPQALAQQQLQQQLQQQQQQQDAAALPDVATDTQPATVPQPMPTDRQSQLQTPPVVASEPKPATLSLPATGAAASTPAPTAQLSAPEVRPVIFTSSFAHTTTFQLLGSVPLCVSTWLCLHLVSKLLSYMVGVGLQHLSECSPQAAILMLKLHLVRRSQQPLQAFQFLLPRQRQHQQMMTVMLSLLGVFRNTPTAASVAPKRCSLT